MEESEKNEHNVEKCGKNEIKNENYYEWMNNLDKQNFTSSASFSLKTPRKFNF